MSVLEDVRPYALSGYTPLETSRLTGRERSTVRAAYQRLRDEGFVIPQFASGRYQFDDPKAEQALRRACQKRGMTGRQLWKAIHKVIAQEDMFDAILDDQVKQ